MTASIPHTIASLLPSSTEILYALGLGERVVGVSHECDWPPEARELPRLTEKKIDTDQPSGEIDRAIGDLLARGETVYRVRADLLARLRPDLIVTQDQCDVCAVTSLDVRGALEEAQRSAPDYSPSVLSLSPASLGDVLEDVRRVGEAAGAPAETERLLADLRARVESVEEMAGDAMATRPRVTFIDWIDPLILAGDWVPEMIRISGGVSQPAGEGKAARVSWDVIVAFAPEVVIVAPCGIALDRAAEEAGSLASRPGWGDLPAARYGRVYAVDGNALFNRPSHRIVLSLELLAEILHPNLFRGTVPEMDRYCRRMVGGEGA